MATKQNDKTNTKTKYKEQASSAEELDRSSLFGFKWPIKTLQKENIH